MSLPRFCKLCKRRMVPHPTVLCKKCRRLAHIFDTGQKTLMLEMANDLATKIRKREDKE